MGQRSHESIRETTLGFWEHTAVDYDGARALYARERYPESRYRFRRVTEMAQKAAAALGGADKARWLDIGCGVGEMLEALVELGAKPESLIGVDYSPAMVEKVRSLLGPKGLDKISLSVADATDLKDIPDASIDVVLAIQTYGYIPSGLEARYYGEATRVLRPGGFLITAEANCLFDLYTLNRFTLGFYRENLLAHGFEGEALDAISAKIAGLLTKPELPPRTKPAEAGSNPVAAMFKDPATKYTSSREHTFTKRENPLIYGRLLGEHGLMLEDLAFYHFHTCPPLLFYDDPALERRAEALEDVLCRQWNGYFMASSFVALARKGGSR